MSVQIPEKMQAVVCHGPHDYRLEDVAVPQRRAGEAPGRTGAGCVRRLSARPRFRVPLATRC